MAMTKCKECKMLISSQARSCPSCGYAAKKTSFVTWLALFAVVVIGFSMMTKDPVPSPPPVAELTPAQKAEKAESERRGTALFKAEYEVRSKLKDADSAKFGASFFREPYFVCGFVNAKNSFGGYTGEKGYIVDYTTRTVLIEGSSTGFAEKWKKACS